MKRPLFAVAVLTIIGAASAFAQSAASPNTSEGLELLKQVAQSFRVADNPGFVECSSCVVECARIILLGEIQDERARGNVAFHFGSAGFW